MKTVLLLVIRLLGTDVEGHLSCFPLKFTRRGENKTTREQSINVDILLAPIYGFIKKNIFKNYEITFGKIEQNL